MFTPKRVDYTFRRSSKKYYFRTFNTGFGEEVHIFEEETKRKIGKAVLRRIGNFEIYELQPNTALTEEDKIRNY